MKGEARVSAPNEQFDCTTIRGRITGRVCTARATARREQTGAYLYPLCATCEVGRAHVALLGVPDRSGDPVAQTRAHRVAEAKREAVVLGAVPEPRPTAPAPREVPRAQEPALVPVESIRPRALSSGASNLLSTLRAGQTPSAPIAVAARPAPPPTRPPALPERRPPTRDTVPGSKCAREDCREERAIVTLRTRPELTELCWADRQRAAVSMSNTGRWPKWMPVGSVQAAALARVETLARMIAERLTAMHGEGAEAEAERVLSGLEVSK